MVLKLSLVIDSSASLKDLDEYYEKGEPVYRSAHIGNHTLHNMAHVRDSISNVLFDLNVRDGIYFPQYIIDRGHLETIGDVNKFSTLQQEVVGTHYDKLCSVFPDQSKTISVYSSVLFENKDVVKDCLNKVGEFTVEESLWAKKVSSNGLVEKVSPSSWNQILEEGVFCIDSMESGWVIPNQLNVALYAYLEGLMTGNFSVSHSIAGLSMAGYINSYKNHLECIFGKILPSSIKAFNLVVYPASSTIFGYESGDGFEQMLELTNFLQENVINSEILSENHNEVVNKLGQTKARTLKSLLRSETAKALLYNPKKTNKFPKSSSFTTQHSLEKGKRFQSTPLNENLSFNTLSSLRNLLLRVK